MFGLIALIGLALLSLVGLFAFVRAANNVAKEDPRKNVKKFQQKEEEVRFSAHGAHAKSSSDMWTYRQCQ